MNTTLPVSRKRACTLNLGSHCGAQSAAHVTSLWHYLNSQASPGRRKRGTPRSPQSQGAGGPSLGPRDHGAGNTGPAGGPSLGPRDHGAGPAGDPAEASHPFRRILPNQVLMEGIRIHQRISGYPPAASTLRRSAHPLAGYYPVV